MNADSIRISMLVLLIALGAAAGCGEDPTATAQPSRASRGVRPDDHAKINILFVGNSLTYMNDLPGLLEAMIEAADAGPAHISAITFGNAGLEDHWRRGDVRTAFAQGGWDVIVLQQGPSATEGRPSLLEYSKKFAAEIPADSETRIALYQVWPSSQRDFDFDGVCESYKMAAEQCGGLLYPVGQAWRLAWAREPELELYGGDGFHPSRLGSYLAALVMFEQLTAHSPIGLPANLKTKKGRTYKLPAETATLLQEVAAEANEKFALP